MMFKKVQIATLRSASILVPAPERPEWLAEWKAELWYVDHGAMRFCLGSFNDAFWIRRNSTSSNTHAFRLHSAFACLLFLSALATTSVLLAFCSQITAIPSRADLIHPTAVFRPFLVLTVFSSLVLLAVAPTIRFGEYPATRYAPAPTARLRRWIFLGLKLSLVSLISLFGGLDAATIFHIPPAPVVGIAYILGFRWALLDQQRRCPVCLCLLSNPIQIGYPSQSFLEPCGTEFVCARGHGTLFVPEISTSWYGAQRWLYLDPDWSKLPT